MKIAHVKRPWYSDDILESKDCYTLVLCQDLLRDKEYQSKIMNSSRNGYLILDNGACEGDMVPPATLIKTANIICANEIVLPDVLRDFKTSLDMQTQFIYKYRRNLENYKFMIVLHGLTLAETITNATELVRVLKKICTEEELRNVTIGIPKYTASFEKSARLKLAKHVRSLIDCEIHLLGASELEGIDELLSSNYKDVIDNIRGMDSSSFIKYIWFAGKETYNSINMELRKLGFEVGEY